jgi:hypothetical protein
MAPGERRWTPLADWRAHVSNAARFIQHWRWRAPAVWSVNDLLLADYMSKRSCPTLPLRL